MKLQECDKKKRIEKKEWEFKEPKWIFHAAKS